MRDLVLACIVFGSLPFVLTRPFLGALLLAWLGYMNPHKLAWGFMVTVPVVHVVTLATLVGMVNSKAAKRMVWSRETVLLAVFVVWMGITTTQALFFGFAVDQYIKVIKIQILTFMALMLLTSKEKIHLFVWVLVVSLGFYGVKGGIFTILHGGEYRIWGPANTFIGGNNELALALVMTIPLMRFLQMQETRKSIRLGLTAGMLLTAISAIGSQSRGALVALLLTGGIFWLKSRNKLASAVFMLIAAVVVLIMMPESYWERMNTIKSYDSDASALGRINAWWVAFNVAQARFFGGGFEMFQWETFQMYAPEPDRVHDVHSIYFEVLGEHGFIGLFFFLALLLFTWGKCSATIRLVRKRPSHAWAGDLSRMIQVSLVAYMVVVAFLGMAYFDYLYQLIALEVVVHHLASTVVHDNKSVVPNSKNGLSQLVAASLARER